MNNIKIAFLSLFFSIGFILTAQENIISDSDLWSKDINHIDDIITNNSPIVFDEDLLIARRTISSPNSPSSRNDTTDFVYYPDGKLHYSISRYWDDYSQDWLNNQKRLNEYYDNGLIHISTSQYWNGYDWENSFVLKYEYNENEERTSVLVESWSSGYISDLRMTSYIYDENNQVIQLLGQEDIDGEWVNTQQILYTYTEDLFIESIRQDWDDAIWINNSKSISVLNESDQIIERRYEQWIYEEWVPVSKSLFEFDDQGNLILETFQNVNSFGELENSLTIESEYNQQNDITQLLAFIWSDSEIIHRELRTYAYDERYNLSVLTTATWTETSSEWLEDYNVYYYYQFVSSIDESISDNEVGIFPNPSTGNFQISFGSNIFEQRRLEVFSIDGRKIEEQTIETNDGNSSVNLNHLANGSYILNIISKDNNTSKKVIIQK